MSTLKVNNLQVGQDGTAANNYTLYQPASPDGTVRLGSGVAGSVTDILTLKNGNLGIGTTNPTQKLHVEGHLLAVDGSSGLMFEEISNGAALWLDGANGDFSGGDYYGIIANNNAQLQLGYAGDSDLVLTSAGNVGINRTDPNQKLNINGNIEVNAYDSANAQGGYNTAGGLIIGNAYDAGKTTTDDRNAIIWQERGLDLDIATNDTLRMKITYDGNVNIGNKNHLSHHSTVDSLQIGYALNLYEDSYTNGTDNYVVLGNNVHYNSGNKYMRNDEASRIMMQAGTFYFQSAAAGTAGNAITFSDVLRITPGGQVNIGGDFTQSGFTSNITRNSSETDILRIKGNGGNAFIRFEDSDASSSFTLGADDAVGSNGFALYDRSDNAYRLVVDTSGDVGINQTTPTSQSGKVLHISGDHGGQARIHLSTSASGHGADEGHYIVSQGAESGSVAGQLAIINCENRNIAFNTGSAGQNYTRVTIQHDGNLNIADGNLVIGTNGHGIDFSAAGNVSGMSSELLDDYEEGTWTPTVSGTTGGSFTAGNTNQGYYVKVGRMVTASATIHWSSATYNGLAYIGGLPFAANSTSPYRAAAIIPGQNNAFHATGSFTDIKAGIDWGLTYVYVVQVDETATSGTTYNHSPALSGGTGFIYGFTLTYQTD